MSLKVVVLFIGVSLLFFGCKTPKHVLHEVLEQNYTLLYIDIKQSKLEGNIAIDVVDDTKSPLKDYRIVIRNGKEVVFDFMQGNSRSVYYTDGNDLVLEVSKTGYKTVLTKPFATDPDMEKACLFLIKMEKE